jgi:hypothetical protein
MAMSQAPERGVRVRTLLTILCLLCIRVIPTYCAPMPSDGTNESESRRLLQDAQVADARSAGGSSFRLRAKFVTEHAGLMTEVGSYLLLWSSPTKWREEVSTSDFNQVRIAGEGGIWEARKPAYQSLRIWQLMQALAFSSRFSLWRDENPSKVKVTKKNGVTVRCIETKLNDSLLRNLCFNETSEQLVSEHYVPSDRTYEFTAYYSVGAKKFPRQIKVYDGKTLAVDFSVTEIEEVPQFEASSFARPDNAQWRIWCPNPEPASPLPIISRGSVPPIRHVVVFGIIGTTGEWSGLHILESGGERADASALDEVKRGRFKPATCGGVPVTVEAVFRR